MHYSTVIQWFCTQNETSTKGKIEPVDSSILLEKSMGVYKFL